MKAVGYKGSLSNAPKNPGLQAGDIRRTLTGIFVFSQVTFGFQYTVVQWQ
jgi:hypothetical protein